MSRIKGLTVFVGGVILFVIGLGMYISPELDWRGFLGAWVVIIKDIIRLAHDPFAILGILVMITALFVVVNGVRRLVRG